MTQKKICLAEKNMSHYTRVTKNKMCDVETEIS